jgi:hypothetical protein
LSATFRRTTGPRRRSLAGACVSAPVTAVAVKITTSLRSSQCDGAFGSPVINHRMFRISASLFPALTRSPTRFPNNALATGETCEMVPRQGFASSSPTLRHLGARRPNYEDRASSRAAESRIQTNAARHEPWHHILRRMDPGSGKPQTPRRKFDNIALVKLLLWCFLCLERPRFVHTGPPPTKRLSIETVIRQPEEILLSNIAAAHRVWTLPQVCPNTRNQFP